MSEGGYARVVIPTYNRSAKLTRTLDCYGSFGAGRLPEIVVLDGSDTAYSAENQRQCARHPNVTYVSRPGSGFVPRLIEFLLGEPADSAICLGTDEDVFVPDYLAEASRFLREQRDYSMLVGRYLTFLRPLGPLHRLSHHRDVVTDLDIPQPEIARRAALLSTAISAGCAPVFWGVRRAGQLLQSLMCQDQLHFQTSQEVIDQILLAYQGRIRFVPAVMLLRDETNLDYIVTEDRQHSVNYFPPEEHEQMLSILAAIGGDELVRAGAIFADRYRQEFVAKGSPCLAVQDHDKAYWKYQPLSPEGRNGVYRALFLMMKGTAVFAELSTAIRDVRVLKRAYGKAPLEIFTRRVRSNQLN